MVTKRKRTRTAPPAAKKEKIEPPTGNDPFGEDTLQRRMWALRVAKKISRYKFAQDLDVAYTTVDQWDRGAMPSLQNILDAISVLKLNGDETLMLLYGRAGRPPAPGYDPDPEIGEREIVRMLKELAAADATRRALGEYRASQAGRYARMTRLFIQGFVQKHDSALDAGATDEEALQSAVDGGFELRAKTLAVMGGGRVVTANELREQAERDGEPLEVRERSPAARTAKLIEASPKRPKPLAHQASLPSVPAAPAPKRKRRRSG